MSTAVLENAFDLSDDLRDDIRSAPECVRRRMTQDENGVWFYHPTPQDLADFKQAEREIAEGRTSSHEEVHARITTWFRENP